MNGAGFWQVVESAIRASGVDQTKMREALLGRLTELRSSEILDFSSILSDLVFTANSWHLRGAAYVIGGGCGDDDFLDFREWLVCKGERVYEQAVSNPDSLADVVIEGENVFFEGFGAIVDRAYEAVEGTVPCEPQNAIISDPRRAISGRRWRSDAELRQAYPRLYARFAILNKYAR